MSPVGGDEPSYPWGWVSFPKLLGRCGVGFFPGLGDVETFPSLQSASGLP